jgi:hypothetical protein
MVDLSMAIFSHNQIVIPVLNDCKWKIQLGLTRLMKTTRYYIPLFYDSNYDVYLPIIHLSIIAVERR